MSNIELRVMERLRRKLYFKLVTKGLTNEEMEKLQNIENGLLNLNWLKKFDKALESF